MVLSTPSQTRTSRRPAKSFTLKLPTRRAAGAFPAGAPGLRPCCCAVLCAPALARCSCPVLSEPLRPRREGRGSPTLSPRPKDGAPDASPHRAAAACGAPPLLGLDCSVRRAPGQTFAEDEPHRPPYNVPPGRQHNVRVAVRALCCAVPAPASCAFCSAGGSRAAFRAAGTPSSCRHSVVMAADALDLGNLWVRGGLGSRLQYRAGSHTCTRRFPIEVKDFEIPLASAAPTIHMSTVNPCPCFGIAGCPLPVARDRAGSTSPAARYGRDSTRWSRPRATGRPRDSTASSPPPPPLPPICTAGVPLACGGAFSRPCST